MKLSTLFATLVVLAWNAICVTAIGNCPFPYTCPENSYPDPSKSCIQGFGDCICNYQHVRENGFCVCPNVCATPAYVPKPGYLCPTEYWHCQCAPGFWRECVERWCYCTNTPLDLP